MSLRTWLVIETSEFVAYFLHRAAIFDSSNAFFPLKGRDTKARLSRSHNLLIFPSKLLLGAILNV